MQAFAIAGGLLIGGLWALGTFVALRSVDRASEELARLRNTLLETRIDALQESALPGDPAFLIRVTAQVENKGNRPLTIRLDKEPPLRICKVVKFSDSQDPNVVVSAPILSRIKAGAEQDDNIGEQIVRPSEIYRYPAMFRVEERGVYLVVFATQLEGEESAERPKAWLASTYVVVR